MLATANRIREAVLPRLAARWPEAVEEGLDPLHIRRLRVRHGRGQALEISRLHRLGIPLAPVVRAARTLLALANQIPPECPVQVLDLGRAGVRQSVGGEIGAGCGVPGWGAGDGLDHADSVAEHEQRVVGSPEKATWPSTSWLLSPPPG